MAPFKNDCGQKKAPSSGRFQKIPSKNDCGKKIRSEQCKIQKTPSKNDCGQKKPTQAVQDTKWHLFENDCGQKNVFFGRSLFY